MSPVDGFRRFKKLPSVTITIGGVSGAGKTTVAQQLAQALQAAGQHVTYRATSREQEREFWARVELDREFCPVSFDDEFLLTQRRHYRIVDIGIDPEFKITPLVEQMLRGMGS